MRGALISSFACAALVAVAAGAPSVSAQAPVREPTRPTTAARERWPATPAHAAAATVELLRLAAATVPGPAVPTSRSLADVESWARTVLAPWVDAHATLAAHLRAAATDARADVDAATLACVAGALGLELVEAIGGSPVPEEVAADPELLATYQRAVDGRRAGFVAQARADLTTCAQRLPSTEPSWRRFCEGTLRRLPRIPGPTSTAATPPPTSAPRNWHVVGVMRAH